MIFLTKYLAWRFSLSIIAYWKVVLNFSIFWFHWFGILLLLKTLFATWKRDIEPATKGFSFKEWFNRHLFNLFSRLIGFIVRGLTIVFTITLEIFWWIISIAIFPLWFLLPATLIVLLIRIPDSINSINFSQTQTASLTSTVTNYENIFTSLLTLIGIILLIIILVLIEIRVIKSQYEKRYLTPDTDNPKNHPWFKSVALRLSIDYDTLRNIWNKEELKNLLRTNGITQKEFEKLVNWEITFQKEIYQKRFWWRKDYLKNVKPLTESWAFGWTFMLDKFSRTLSYHTGLPFLSSLHPKPLELLKSALKEQAGSNVILTGDTGVGKTRLVEELAKQISSRSDTTELSNKRFVKFQLDDLLAVSSKENVKIKLLKKVFAETVAAGNIILFIPSLYSYLEPTESDDKIGEVDISMILVEFLSSTDIHIVTTATARELNSVMQKKSNLAKYFKVIKLEEPNDADSLLAVRREAQILESKHGVLISYSGMKKALTSGKRYSQEPAMPGRAVDFLQELVVYWTNKKEDKHFLINSQDVEEFASIKYGFSMGEVKKGEKEQLLKIEKEMEKMIIGQRPAIKATSSALRRRRMDLSNPERPAGCFLFIGPTGVGKTHTAEVLADLYFKSQAKIARFDMSEYQDQDAIQKLLGDASGKIEGQFHKVLTENPFNLILLDELEKASKEVHQILLQIMEEGMAKTGTGQKLNFRESIIIATSNAKSEFIRKMFNQKENYDKIKKVSLEKIHNEGIFSPELLNRFDDIIAFHPLNPNQVFEVTGLILKGLVKRLEKQDILVSYAPEFQKRLAEVGFDRTFGARQIRRVVQTNIEDAVAKDLLEGNIQKGEKFELPLKYLDNPS